MGNIDGGWQVSIKVKVNITVLLSRIDSSFIPDLESTFACVARNLVPRAITIL